MLQGLVPANRDRDRIMPFTEPPHGEGPNVCAWWLEPCGFATWSRPGTVLTLDDAQWMASAFSPAEARTRFGPDYCVAVYHDWHRARGVEPRVRPTIVRWATSFTRRHLGAVQLAVPPSTSRVLAMAISTGTMVLRLAGYDITLVDELESVYPNLRPLDPGRADSR